MVKNKLPGPQTTHRLPTANIFCQKLWVVYVPRMEKYRSDLRYQSRLFSIRIHWFIRIEVIERYPRSTSSMHFESEVCQSSFRQHRVFPTTHMQILNANEYTFRNCLSTALLWGDSNF